MLYTHGAVADNSFPPRVASPTKLPCTYHSPVAPTIPRGSVMPALVTKQAHSRRRAPLHVLPLPLPGSSFLLVHLTLLSRSSLAVLSCNHGGRRPSPFLLSPSASTSILWLLRCWNKGPPRCLCCIWYFSLLWQTYPKESLTA